VLGQIVFLGPLILHTFAAFSLWHLVYLQLRQDPLGRQSWGGWVWRAITFDFAIFFSLHLWAYLRFLFLYGKVHSGPLLAQILFIAAQDPIGPLLMLLFYQTERERLPWPSIWKPVLGGVWTIAVAVFTLTAANWLKILPFPVAQLELFHNFRDGVLAFSAFSCGLIMVLSRRADDGAFQRRRRRWYLAIVTVVLLYLILQTFRASALFEGLVLRFLPLVFLFVTTYYGERLVFFDVFVKRGLYFLLSLIALTSCFALTLARFDLQKFGFMRSWVPAFLLLPIALAAPWFHARLNRWVDRYWLGRRFSPAEAADFFYRTIQDVTNEPELLEAAETSLSRIFQSAACIDLNEAEIASEHVPGELRVSFATGQRQKGGLRILPRHGEVPFLSEDSHLLATLARSFAAMLENQRLRDEKAGHMEREQQLQLNATRADLKALRAQVNPHFLFNALGAIASLIPKDPGRAEETVEQLAEVFRYTLQRSEREWVFMADEIEFVRAYLYVEQMRFGERLQVRTEIEDGIGKVRVPAMVVQTLVENAVKHGVASVRGQALIVLSARRSGSRIVVAVQDNGPGFSPLPAPGKLPESKSGGFGLNNVQARLRAYYGDEAELRFRRDPATGTTEVAITFPPVSAMAQESGRTS
jgi:signal transduction histidine kinase